MRAMLHVMSERPAFAKRYPSDDELDALVDAFCRGDYALVRREAPRLAERAEDPAVKRAATDLRRRLDPTPLAVYLIALGGALLLFLFAYYLLHRG